MNLSDQPARSSLVFAQNAGGSYVRNIPQTTGDADAASFDLGFPPNTFVDPGAGGTPPDGRDFNGILQFLSAWARWAMSGGPMVYNSAFATAIGGYPRGARLSSVTVNGREFVSTADNNTTDPEGVTPANWVTVNAVPYTTQAGIFTGPLTAGAAYLITFPTPFPTALIGYSITPVNVTGNPFRDNFLQRQSFDRFGITALVQGANTGGDQTLDGIDWVAWGY